MEDPARPTEYSLFPKSHEKGNVFRTGRERPFVFSSSLRQSQPTFSWNCRCRSHSRLYTDAGTRESFPVLPESPERSLRLNPEALSGLQRRLGIPSNPEMLPRIADDRSCMVWTIFTIVWNIISSLWNDRRQATQGAIVPDENEIVDAIFVSLDFGYNNSSRSHRRKSILEEVGISTFDTRDVLHPGAPPEKIISTFHFQIKKPIDDFQFGRSEVTIEDWILHHLRQLFYLDDDPGPELRKIILVGHSIDNKIHLLKLLGVDLGLSPAIIDVVDTNQLAGHIMGQDAKCRLEDVTRHFDMKGDKFHNAGNGANYTLRIMLLLATNHCEGLMMTSSQSELGGVL